MNKKTINDIVIKDKKVLMRVDFNVPIKDGVIQDDNRIKMALPSIKKVISEGGKLIIFSHLGRIASEEDKVKSDLAPIAKDLSDKLGIDVKFINATRGPELETAINNMNNGEIVMFQNTRFEDLNNKAESKNDPELGKYWASLGDVFVNDAFGTAHRAHASNVGISANIAESAVGLLVEEELRKLTRAVDNPEKPLVVIIGGAKVSDKIGLIKSFLTFADYVVAGGGMATTFTKAMGHSIGTSLLQEDFIDTAKELLDEYPEKLIIPVDFAVADDFKDNPRIEIDGRDIEDNFMVLDAGPKTIEKIKEILKGAKTVVWNGPLGVSEFENYEFGTREVAKAIAELPDAYSVIGGGDSAAAAIKLGFADKFSHISTGGGASMTLLEGLPLPGIESIQNK